MKGQFPQFDPGAAVDYKTMWERSLFVFDTNVLLNLYRYQASTRDQLLDVLDKLSDRIWIPHHVALEFQRNRFSVLADQNRRFSEVKNLVNKSKEGLRSDLEKLKLDQRHSLIDPSPLVDGFDALAGEFLSSLEKIQRDQQKLTEPDPLKDKIETLFSGCVGVEVEGQSEVDAIYVDAEKRYQLEIPPGYMDANKDKQGPEEYVHGGVNYKRKYGDYLIWHQLLSHSKEQGVESVVFVTDDAKEDWWWKVHSDGPKTLGPRPELRDEASRMGGIAQFNMYKPEGFLTHSQKFLKSTISNEAIQEVRDVSRVRLENTKTPREEGSRAYDYEFAVTRWLRREYEKLTINRGGYPDFIIEEDGLKLGFEVKRATGRAMITSNLQQLVAQALAQTITSDLDSLTIVFVSGSRLIVSEYGNRMLAKLGSDLPQTVNIVIGLIDFDKSDIPNFTPLRVFSGNSSGKM